MTDVFLRDRRTGAVERLSISSRGAHANYGGSYPAPAIAPQKIVGSLGSPTTGGITAYVSRCVAPRVEERLHGAPAGLDVVGALEQRRIADQTVVKQRSAYPV